jgi:hypothetical protein
METKKYLYAAVGAQVAVVRSAQAKLEELKSMLDENTSSASSDMKSRIDTWAGEGEQFLGKVTDAKTLDDLTSKVDFDQVQTQVNKLRDQLEDIVGTWRANFRPESKPAEKVVVSATAVAPKAAAKPTTASKPAAKKPAAKAAAKATTAKTTASKPAAKKPTARKPAAKKPTTSKPAANKPAAKATTAKTTASKPAAQKAS